MEVFILDYGDSYDRGPIGIATDRANARVIAKEYLFIHGIGYEPYTYFAITRHKIGELSPLDWLLDSEQLDIDEETL